MSIVTDSKFEESIAVQAPTAASRPRLICHCLKVTHDEVQQCIVDNSATSVHDVMRGCGAGKGCTACHCRIKDLLAAHVMIVVNPGGAVFVRFTLVSRW